MNSTVSFSLMFTTPNTKMLIIRKIWQLKFHIIYVRTAQVYAMEFLKYLAHLKFGIDFD